jgi:cytochrome b involved in lipid metabolism
VQEQPSTKPKNSNNVHRKCLSMFVGLVLLGGVVVSIVALVDFMKTNDIQFVPDEAGTTAITMSELALHSTPDDCWVVLHGDVYDLTNYARRHPGGASIITQLAGIDGAQEYARFHSESLLRSVQGDKIGPLTLMDNAAGTSAGNTNNNNGATNNNGTPEDTNNAPTVLCDAAEPDCISMAELQSHNSQSDCWVALHGDVYDLTSYANRHPGGARVVTNLAGTDGTSEYRRFHSQGLLSSLSSDTLVGRLQTYVTPTNTGNANVGEMESEDDSEDEEDSDD